MIEQPSVELLKRQREMFEGQRGLGGAIGVAIPAPSVPRFTYPAALSSLDEQLDRLEKNLEKLAGICETLIGPKEVEGNRLCRTHPPCSALSELILNKSDRLGGMNDALQRLLSELEGL